MFIYLVPTRGSQTEKVIFATFDQDTFGRKRAVLVRDKLFSLTISRLDLSQTQQLNDSQKLRSC
jgi:hypothetical protein